MTTDIATGLKFEIEEKRHPKLAGESVLYAAPTTPIADLSDEERAAYDAVKAIPDDQFGASQAAPDGASVGDTYTAAEILEAWDGESPLDEGDDEEEVVDADERALAEAQETGGRVTIGTTTAPCDGSEGDECSTDRVTRIATPEGEIETRRTHTY